MTLPPTSASLDDVLRFLGLAGEQDQIECKESAWQLPKDIWETVSAFANTSGGTLLLGIAEQGGRFQVAGLLDAPKIQHDLVSGLRAVLNVPIAAQIDALVVNTGAEERVLLSAYIPEAIAYQKPVYIRSRGLDKGCYKRVGGHDMPCTEDDLARLFQDRALISPDMLPMPLAHRNELDGEQIRAFRQLLATQNSANAVLSYDDDDLLRAYGALSQPKGESDWLPTVAGVLMFGTPTLIQRCFPAFRVDLIEVEVTEWVTASTERGAGRSFQGSLLEVTRELLRVLRQEIPERFALRPGETQRMADPMHVALREAIHNAVMHQDYRIHRPTQVRRFADRLEIENPGASLRDPDRLGEPGSELRNPRIAQMYYEIGWAEQKGTGIRAMQQAMAELGLTPPAFESNLQDRSFRVTFYRHHFMDRDDLAWLDQFRAMTLSTEEQKALVYARKTGRVDNAIYRSLNRADTLASSRSLTRLEGLGLLRRSEQRRGPGVFYTLATDQADGTPKITPKITPKTRTELLRLLGEGKRLSKADTESLILLLCAEAPRTARELADILHRNVDYVRNAYLSGLVNAGQLQLTGLPNDPNVAYRAGSEGDGRSSQ